MSLFTVFLASAISALLTQPLADPNVSSVENKVLDARRGIRSGEIELRSTISDYVDGRKKSTKNSVTTVWFDGDRIRRDRRRPYEERPDGTTLEEYRETTCLGDSYHIFWTDQILPGGRTVVVHLTTDVKLLNPKDPDRLCHPRLLGMAPIDSFNLVHYGLESYFGRPDREAPTIQRENWAGTDCWRIQYALKDGLTLRAWVAPDKGYAPIRLQSEFVSGMTPCVLTLDSDVEQAPRSDIWFPRHCHFVRKENGLLVREELLDIKVQSLNKGIPDPTFRATGMEIPAGTHVQANPRDPRGELVWDGKDFVPRKDIPNRGSGRLQADTRPRRLFVCVSLGLAFVGSLVSYRCH